MFRYLAPIALVMAPASAQHYPTPEQVVAGHEAAYMALDLDAFMSFYAPDAEVHGLGEVLRGRKQIRNAYRAVFSLKKPQQEMVDRWVDGDQVIDVERIVLPNGEVICCQSATYTVKNGKIIKVVLAMD